MPDNVINDAGTTVFDVANDPSFQDSGANDDLFNGPAEGSDSQEGSGDDEAVAESTETTPDKDEFLEDFLKKLGVNNPNDPSELAKVDVNKLLKRLSDQDKHIRTLKQTPAEKEPDIDWTEGLQLPKEAKAEEATPEPKAAEAALDDIGKGWKAPVDAIRDENAAFESGEFEKVAEIRQAALIRHFNAMVGPHLKDLTTRLAQFEQKYGDVTEQTKKSLETQQRQEDQNFALESVKRDQSLGEAIGALFAPAAEGETVEFKGQKFPATPFNKIVVDNPWLLDIQVQDENPRIAVRKTYAARYRAAAKIYQTANQQDPKKAISLVKAGRDMERRRQDTDRVRQSLNAGKGATTQTNKPRKDYAHEVMDATSDSFNVLNDIW